MSFLINIDRFITTFTTKRNFQRISRECSTRQFTAFYKILPVNRVVNKMICSKSTGIFISQIFDRSDSLLFVKAKNCIISRCQYCESILCAVHSIEQISIFQNFHPFGEIVRTTLEIGCSRLYIIYLKYRILVRIITGITSDAQNH